MIYQFRRRCGLTRPSFGLSGGPKVSGTERPQIFVDLTEWFVHLSKLPDKAAMTWRRAKPNMRTAIPCAAQELF